MVPRSNDPDPSDEAARAMIEQLQTLKPEAQQAYRHLFARVALDTGLLVFIGEELRPTGKRLVCQEPTSGAFSAVDRPPEWSDEEGELYAKEMRSRLLGDNQAP